MSSSAFIHERVKGLDAGRGVQPGLGPARPEMRATSAVQEIPALPQSRSCCGTGRGRLSFLRGEIQDEGVLARPHCFSNTMTTIATTNQNTREIPQPATEAYDCSMCVAPWS